MDTFHQCWGYDLKNILMYHLVPIYSLATVLRTGLVVTVGEHQQPGSPDKRTVSLKGLVKILKSRAGFYKRQWF